jgi:hypothetical protein
LVVTVVMVMVNRSFQSPVASKRQGVISKGIPYGHWRRRQRGLLLLMFPGVTAAGGDLQQSAIICGHLIV